MVSFDDYEFFIFNVAQVISFSLQLVFFMFCDALLGYWELTGIIKLPDSGWYSLSIPSELDTEYNPPKTQRHCFLALDRVLEVTLSRLLMLYENKDS